MPRPWWPATRSLAMMARLYRMARLKQTAGRSVERRRGRRQRPAHPPQHGGYACENVASAIYRGLVVDGLYAGDVYAYQSQYGPSGVTYYDKAKSYGGYTLFTPSRSGPPPDFKNNATYLIDMEGHVVKTWPLPKWYTIDKHARTGFTSTDSEFYVIDHQGTFVPGAVADSIALAAGPKGDFLFRWGNPAVSDSGAGMSYSEATGPSDGERRRPRAAGSWPLPRLRQRHAPSGDRIRVFRVARDQPIRRTDGARRMLPQQQAGYKNIPRVHG